MMIADGCRQRCRCLSAHATRLFVERALCIVPSVWAQTGRGSDAGKVGPVCSLAAHFHSDQLSACSCFGGPLAPDARQQSNQCAH